MRTTNTRCICNGYGCLSLANRNVPCPGCRRITSYDPLSRRDRYVVMDEQGEPVMYADKDYRGVAA
jgi:hypothetical protein